MEPDHKLVKLSSINDEGASTSSSEWKKSTPLRTYSKKNLSLSPPPDTTSRYGRRHKQKVSKDFVDTETISSYLKLNKYDAQLQENRPQKRVYSGLSKKRGKPRRVSAPAELHVAAIAAIRNKQKKQKLSLYGKSSLEAPAPTSTETLDVPSELVANDASYMRILMDHDEDNDSLITITNKPIVEERVDDEKITDELILGDMAWACVAGYPFWPCAIVKDPFERISFKYQGKMKARKKYHVRFFGDNGRRSWVDESYIMPFFEPSEFTNKAAAYTTQKMKRDNFKLYKQYFIAPHWTKIWQAACSEAQSLVDSPRSDRLQYFHQFLSEQEREMEVDDFPDIKPQLDLSPPNSSPLRTYGTNTYLKSSLKNSSVCKTTKKVTLVVPENNNTPKKDSSVTNPSQSNAKNCSKTFISEIKQEDLEETESPVEIKVESGFEEKTTAEKSNLNGVVVKQKKTNKKRGVKVEEILKRKRGRPRKDQTLRKADGGLEAGRKRGRPRKDQTLPKREGKCETETNKLTNQNETPNPVEVKSNQSLELKTDKKLKQDNSTPPKAKKTIVKPKSLKKVPQNENDGFNAYAKVSYTTMSQEHPEMSKKEKKKVLEKSWNALSKSSKLRYVDKKSDTTADLSESDTDERDLSDDMHLKKNKALFAGAPTRVCIVCFEPNDLIKCQGSCVTYMHKECSTLPRYNTEYNYVYIGGKLINLNDKSKKKKRGRPSQNKLEPPLKKQRLDDDTEDMQTDPDPSESILNGTQETCENTIVDNSFSNETEETMEESSSENGSVETKVRPKLSPLNSFIEKLRLGGVVYKKLWNNLYKKAENCGEKASWSNVNEAGNVSSSSSDNVTTIPDEIEKGDKTLTDSVTVEIPDLNVTPITSLPTPPPEDPIPIEKELEQKKSENCVEKIVKNGESIDSESVPSTSSEKDSTEIKPKGWMCDTCANKKIGPCFICYKDAGNIIRCSYVNCGKVYHIDCVQEWPQMSIQKNSKGKVSLFCPMHQCHTCISENPGNISSRTGTDRLVRCLRCPTAYHYGNHCIPAGSKVFSTTQILCPSHYKPAKTLLKKVCNTSWCALCSVGGELICCESCPNCFHLKCLNIPVAPENFRCEDCITGRYVLYGEIVWVKLGTHRWWPGRILYPSEVPNNCKNTHHAAVGEYLVKFYGTLDHAWVNRGRTLSFHEGDGPNTPVNEVKTNQRLLDLYSKGVKDAQDAFKWFTARQEKRELETSSSRKPPKYARIQANKPFGNLKLLMDSNMPSLTACECKPNMVGPCGPDSSCINRMLMVECNPEICPAGAKCRNQNFETKNYPATVPYKTRDRGWGLKILQPVKKGEFIIEYVGEIIDETEYKKRIEKMHQAKQDNFYFLTIDKDRMLDAGPKGNNSRFMNHSCDPNCETQKWTVNGETRVGLFALKNIAAGEELVFDYQMDTGDNTLVQCKCGASSCKGYLGKNKNLEEKEKKLKEEREKALANVKKMPKDKQKKVQKRKIKKKIVKVKKPSSECFTCGELGSRLLCHHPTCSKSYHVNCLGLSKDPEGDWICPWHSCSICSKHNVKRCSLCTNAYCPQHQEGNISIRKNRLICYSHSYSDDDSEEDEKKL